MTLTSRLGNSFPIRWMIDSIIDRNFGDKERVYTFQAPDIEAIFFRVGTTLMMSINSTNTTKIVLGSVSIKLIKPELILALQYLNSRQLYRGDNGSFTAAD